MKIIIEENYEVLSQTVASLILAEIYQEKRVNIDLTDGSSPQGAFDILAKIFQKYPDRLDNVHIYNHDELEGGAIVDGLLRKQIHLPFGFKEENIHRMTFETHQEFMKEIENDGGLDFMLLGLGADGHFCANFPGTPCFDKLVYTYDPKDYPWYEEYLTNMGMTEMPKIATFGFRSVLRAKKVVVVVNGAKKAQAVYDIFNKELSEEIPGTILRLHPNITFVLDEEAASLLKK